MNNVEKLIYGSALGSKYAFSRAMTVPNVLRPAEHLATDTPGISKIHVGLHGKHLLVMLDFNQNWNQSRDFSKNM
jgi:hypothetical protein